MRSLALIIATAGAYSLLRGWDASPPLILRSCLAVAALMLGIVIWGVRKDHAQPRMFSLRKATWIDYLSLVAAVVFAEACFVGISSTLAAPAKEIAGRFNARVAESTWAGSQYGQGGSSSGHGAGGDVVSDGHHSGHWKFSNRIDRQLPPKSNHRPSNKPEVFIVLENQQDATTLLNTRIHLRSFAFSRFNGIAWSAPRIGKNQLRAPITFSQPATPALTGSEINYRVYHAANPVGQNLFTSLSGAASTDLRELTQISESIFLLPGLENPDTGYNYSATSYPIHFADLADISVTPAVAEPGELDLPPELAERIRKTAAVFSSTPSLNTRLLALRYFLQDNYIYSLQTDNPSGANPLENFLYLEKRGYCEHFATAAAMLCRALGVPSRIAYGWSGGRLYPSQNMFVFRAKDAHAWTEIKLDGYGWVVFDTTPTDHEAIPETQTAAEGEQAPDPGQAVTSETPVLTTPDFNPWIPSSCIIVVGLILTGFLITRRRKQPATAADGRLLDYPSPGYLTHFKKTCAALGYPMPVGCTLRQHIARLRDHHAAPDFLQDLLTYHYGITYANSPKNTSTEKHLNHSIRNWAKSAS